MLLNMMPLNMRRFALSLALGCGVSSGLLAEEAIPAVEQAAEEKKPAVAGDEIEALIKQLDAEDFTARQEASERLAGVGEKAVSALEKATAGESREASMRAFDILKGHFEKGTPAVRESAKQALERISKADLGAASRRAGEVLTPPATPATPENGPRIAGRAAMIGPAGGMRIAVARAVMVGGAEGGIETSVKVEDGLKTTEVKEKGRRVKIVDDPAKGIQMEVTETKEGKEKTEKFVAKNAEELKTKHAEAHKLYEQYSQKEIGLKVAGFGGGGVVMRRAIPAIPIPAVPAIEVVPFAPGGFLPVPVPAAPPIPVPVLKRAAADQEQLESLQRAIAAAEASLKEASEDAADNKQLETAQKHLEEALKVLEKLRQK